MSSVRLALAFLLLFLAGFIVGSTSRNALYQGASLAISKLWHTGLLRSITLNVCCLSLGFFFLLFAGERAAALEQTRGYLYPRDTISAEEYLRRRGSF